MDFVSRIIMLYLYIQLYVLLSQNTFLKFECLAPVPQGGALWQFEVKSIGFS